MDHFLGWPGAKAALGLGHLSNRAATLAVWATLQFELAFVLPLCAVSSPEATEIYQAVCALHCGWVETCCTLECCSAFIAVRSS